MGARYSDPDMVKNIPAYVIRDGMRIEHIITNAYGYESPLVYATAEDARADMVRRYGR